MSTTTGTGTLGGDRLRIALVDPTGQLLREIADRRLHQRDVAQTLALLRQWGQVAEVDWTRVGAAAVARWSLAGWRRIKTLAHSGRCWPEEERA